MVRCVGQAQYWYACCGPGKGGILDRDGSSCVTGPQIPLHPSTVVCGGTCVTAVVTVPYPVNRRGREGGGKPGISFRIGGEIRSGGMHGTWFTPVVFALLVMLVGRIAWGVYSVGAWGGRKEGRKDRLSPLFYLFTACLVVGTFGIKAGK